MLMSESLEIGVVVGQAMRDRYGEAELAAHYRAFDTICSATQERQDAVVDLLARERVDLMVVIGGYNSSNTCNLARLCAERVPTYHIADAECLSSPQVVRHRPVNLAKGRAAEIETASWLPAGPVSIGLTAGASTPNAIVGRVVQRLADLCAADDPAAEAGVNGPDRPNVTP
jgi:4-hydroxy-3-methylbut-2-enyl diphosphate reductase